MKNTKVAIIIPVYNDGNYLSVCLDAVIPPARDYGWEILVVDDASTDDSPLIAEGKGARVIRSEVNRGVAASRNLGAASTKAEILVFVDADVQVQPGTLEAMVGELKKRPEVDAVGAYPIIGDLSGHWSAHFVGIQTACEFTWKKGEQARPFSSLQSECGAIRRRVFEAVSGFDERYTGVGMEEFRIAHEMTRLGYTNLLIRSANYLHYYKTLSGRAAVLVHRTARWVPLLLGRAKFESQGTQGTPEKALSCLLTGLMILTCILGLFFSPVYFLMFSLLAVIQIICERRLFQAALRGYGWAMALYSWPALQWLHLAIGIGFLWGVLRALNSRLSSGERVNHVWGE